TCPGYVPGPERRDAPAAPSAGGSRIGHEAAGATGPSAHDARNEGTGGALGRVVRPGPSSSSLKGSSGPEGATDGTATPGQAEDRPSSHPAPKRSEERRVGRECRYGGSPEHEVRTGQELDYTRLL